jgi:hypothetical protein
MKKLKKEPPTPAVNTHIEYVPYWMNEGEVVPPTGE